MIWCDIGEEITTKMMFPTKMMMTRTARNRMKKKRQPKEGSSSSSNSTVIAQTGTAQFKDPYQQRRRQKASSLSPKNVIASTSKQDEAAKKRNERHKRRKDVDGKMEAAEAGTMRPKRRQNGRLSRTSEAGRGKSPNVKVEQEVAARRKTGIGCSDTTETERGSSSLMTEI